MSTISLNKTATQRVFSEVVGLSESAVSQMIGEGILNKDDQIGQWILSYCLHLRETAAGRLATGDLSLVQERALLAKEQRIKIAMQNAVTKRELAPVYLIEEVLAKAGAKVAGILDAIPGHVRRRLPNLPAREIDAIAAEIAKARNIAAAISLDDLAIDMDGEDDQPSTNNTSSPLGDGI